MQIGTQGLDSFDTAEDIREDPALADSLGRHFDALLDGDRARTGCNILSLAAQMIGDFDPAHRPLVFCRSRERGVCGDGMLRSNKHYFK
ncbi:hypothetical protein AB4Z10_08715 [Bosea sp. RAF48]|uniref:hypothetical protein n=1 Tax=Bosea sp. RAF48 TaxID=3237480 RepID=UPI003F924CB0